MRKEDPNIFLEALAHDILSLERKMSAYDERIAENKRESDSRLLENLSMAHRDPKLCRSVGDAESSVVQRLLRDAKTFQEKFKEKQVNIDSHVNARLKLEEQVSEIELDKSRLKDCIYRISEQLARVKAEFSEFKNGSRLRGIGPTSMNYSQSDFVHLQSASTSDTPGVTDQLHSEIIQVTGSQINDTRSVPTRPEVRARLRDKLPRNPTSTLSKAVRNYNIRDD